MVAFPFQTYVRTLWCGSCLSFCGRPARDANHTRHRMANKANIRLGERKGGLSDVQSLQRELDSLRGYRDVLHDTMKGLVEQAAGRLGKDEMPELSASLEKVAHFLAVLVQQAQSQGNGGPNADEFALAKAEVERFRLRAEAAEKELAARAEADLALNVIEQLAAAEAALKDAQRQASLQRMARREWETAATALKAEAETLDEALVSRAIAEAESSFAIERAHARALAQAQAAKERAEDEADAAEKARAAAAEALEAMARNQRRSRDSQDETAVRLADELARATAALEESRSEASAVRSELAGVRAERDRIRDEATELGAECARLKRRVVELESLLASAMNAPAAAPAPKSRFASYVESLESAKAAHSEHNPHDPPRNARGAAWGEPAAQSAVQPPPPPPPTLPLQPAPTHPSTEIRRPSSARGQDPTGIAPAASGSSGSSGSLRPAKERGGALLRRGAEENGTNRPSSDWTKAAPAAPPQPFARPRSLLPAKRVS